MLSGAEIKIVGGLAAGDTLVFENPEGSVIEGSYDPATGVLTLAGAGTAAEYEAILRSVTFEARVDNPSEALRHIALTVYDERGLAGASIEIATTLAVKADPSALVAFGTDDADNLAGTIRGETLIGLAGDDIISGLGGSDTLNGRAGTDTASYADSSTGVTVSLATGTGWGGDAHGDRLVAMENLTGSTHDDNLTGNGSANLLSAGEGDDTLTGGRGADILNGGGGGDIFAFAGAEALGDIFDGGSGIDRAEVTGAAAVRLTSFAASNGIEQWDGNGQAIIGTSAADSFDFSGLTEVTGWSAIDGSGGDDQITGSRFDDTIFGNGGDDTVIGGRGLDTLIGGTGRDFLSGGADRDIFDLNSLGESGVGSANRDQILHFQRGTDDIDLRDIDAKTGVAGNNKFKFIGTDSFNKVKGELRYIDQGSTCLVRGDVNGDGKADLEILVKAGALAEADFLL